MSRTKGEREGGDECFFIGNTEFTDTPVGWKISDVNTVHRKWSDTVTTHTHTHTDRKRSQTCKLILSTRLTSEKLNQLLLHLIHVCFQDKLILD